MKFQIGHEVTLERPIDEVFRALALPDGLERLLRLSPLVTSFTLKETRPGTSPSSQVVVFEFGERVNVLPGGLYSSAMTMRVEQTVDEEARRVDYRSRSKHGVAITIHKIRTFESLPNGFTKVSETVHGDAPPGVHLLARRTARKAHIEHMDSYARLFEGPPA